MSLSRVGRKFQSLIGDRVLSTAHKLVLAKPLPNSTIQAFSNTYSLRKFVWSQFLTTG